MSFQTAKSYIQLFLIIVVLVATYSLTYFFELKKTIPQINQTQTKASDAKNQTIVIKAQSWTLEFSEVAQIQPRTYIPVIPEVTGRIESVSPYFITGKCFKKNQILFSIETDDVKAEYEAAKASLEQAKANIAVIEAEAELAVSEWKIVNDNTNEPIPQLVAKIPQLEQARAEIKSAEARVHVADIDVRNSKFSLPFNGCVSELSLEAGQFVSRGQSLGNVYAHDKLEVTAQLSQDTINMVKAGHFNIDYMSDAGDRVALNINRISPIIDNKTQFFTIVFSPYNVKNLLPHQIGRVYFSSKKPQKVFKLSQEQISVNNTINIVDNHTQKISSFPIEIIAKKGEDIYISAFSDEALILKNGNVKHDSFR